MSRNPSWSSLPAGVQAAVAAQMNMDTMKALASTHREGREAARFGRSRRQNMQKWEALKSKRAYLTKERLRILGKVYKAVLDVARAIYAGKQKDTESLRRDHQDAYFGTGPLQQGGQTKLRFNFEYYYGKLFATISYLRSNPARDGLYIEDMYNDLVFSISIISKKDCAPDCAINFVSIKSAPGKDPQNVVGRDSRDIVRVVRTALSVVAAEHGLPRVPKITLMPLKGTGGMGPRPIRRY